MQQIETQIFATDDVREIVRHVGIDRLMDAIIESLASTLETFDDEHYQVPARDGFHYQNPHMGLLEWMPALEMGHRATVKLVGYHPNNPDSKGLPTILSTAFSLDTGSGHLLAIIDGTFPTALRTGAASAVASRILAVPHASVLGIIGCGAQAVAQLHALARVFPLEQVLVYDIDADTGHAFIARAEALDLDGIRVATAPVDTVVKSSHILCTAISVEVGNGPVIPDVEVAPYLHINAIGSDFPGKRELPDTLLKRSLVCPDALPQAIKEGECQSLAENEIGPDLAKLVKDQARYARHRNGLTVFDSTGRALEDHVVVDVLVEHGRQLGLGAEIQVEAISNDPKNPYDFLIHPVVPGTDESIALKRIVAFPHHQNRLL